MKIITLFLILLFIVSVTFFAKSEKDDSGNGTQVSITKVRIVTIIKAIHDYEREEKKKLKNIIDLVPKYLDAIPEDEWGNKYCLRPGQISSPGKSGVYGLGDAITVKYVSQSSFREPKITEKEKIKGAMASLLWMCFGQGGLGTYCKVTKPYVKEYVKNFRDSIYKIVKSKKKKPISNSIKGGYYSSGGWNNDGDTYYACYSVKKTEYPKELEKIKNLCNKTDYYGRYIHYGERTWWSEIEKAEFLGTTKAEYKRYEVWTKSSEHVFFIRMQLSRYK